MGCGSPGLLVDNDNISSIYIYIYIHCYRRLLTAISICLLYRYKSLLSQCPIQLSEASIHAVRLRLLTCLN